MFRQGTRLLCKIPKTLSVSFRYNITCTSAHLQKIHAYKPKTSFSEINHPKRAYSTEEDIKPPKSNYEQYRDRFLEFIIKVYRYYRHRHHSEWSILAKMYAYGILVSWVILCRKFLIKRKPSPNRVLFAVIGCLIFALLWPLIAFEYIVRHTYYHFRKERSNDIEPVEKK